MKRVPGPFRSGSEPGDEGAALSVFVCPFCGPRGIDEFVFHKTLPTVAGSALEATYLRRDRPLESEEHWQHRLGCRGWLYVRRNPSTGEILEVRLLSGRRL